jgi:hypothetical protein
MTQAELNNWRVLAPSKSSTFVQLHMRYALLLSATSRRWLHLK